MRTSFRSASLLAVLSAVPLVQAGSFTFLGGVNPLWNYQTSPGFYANWLGGQVSTGNASYTDEVYLGLSTSTTLLKSNMNFSFTRLKKLSLDQKGGVELTGNQIRIAGGGAINVGAGTHTMSNALNLNDDGGSQRLVNVAVAPEGTLTATGVWSGNGALIKSGTGTLALTAANTYTDGTVINAGTIKAGADNSLGNGALTFGNGGVLDLNGFSPTATSLSVTDAATITGAGALKLTGNMALNASAGAGTLSGNVDLSAGIHLITGSGNSGGYYSSMLLGNLSGAGGIDYRAGFFRLLSGINTYTGATLVNGGGVLFINSKTALPSTTALVVNGAINFDAPFASGVTADSTVGSLAGTGEVELDGATLTVGDATSTTFSGQLGSRPFGTRKDSGALVKQGSGTLTLSGIGNYQGGTTINAGTIAFGKANALPTTGAVFVNTAGRLALNGFDATINALNGAGTVDLGATTLKVGNGGGNGAFIGKLVGGGVLNKVGGGREDISDANLAGFTGHIQLDEGTLATNSAMANDANLLTLNAGTLEVVASAGATLTRTLPTTMSLVKSGSGVLKVGDQSLGGTTTVSQGGLTVKSGSSFVSGGGFVTKNGAALRLSSTDTTLTGPTFANAGTISGSGEIDAALTNSSTGKVQVGPADRLVFDKGATNGGTLQLDGGEIDFAGALTSVAGSFVTGRGVLSTSSTLQSGTMAFTGATDLHGDVTLTPTAKVQTSGGATLTFWDDVAHNGAEIRTNAGSYTTFKGSVGGAGAYTGLGTVEFDGDLRPGNSPASVSFEGDLVLGSSNVLTMELGGTALGSGYDHLSIGRTAYLGGALRVVEYGGFHVAPGQSFDLFDGVLSGTFSSISLPTTALGWDTRNLYTTGVIRAVPEPASIVALAFGALGLLRRRRQG